MRKHWTKMGEACCKAGWLLSDVPHEAAGFVEAWRAGYIRAFEGGYFNAWKRN